MSNMETTVSTFFWNFFPGPAMGPEMGPNYYKNWLKGKEGEYYRMNPAMGPKGQREPGEKAVTCPLYSQVPTGYGVRLASIRL